LKRRPRLL